eukprot:235209-Alexandrium_andersonii.AAC.1
MAPPAGSQRKPAARRMPLGRSTGRKTGARPNASKGSGWPPPCRVQGGAHKNCGLVAPPPCDLEAEDH